MSLLFGVVLGILSMLGYALSDFFATIASKKMGWFETATISRAASFFVLLILLLIFFKIPYINLKEIVLLVTAGILSSVALQLFYKALKESMLSVAGPINDTSAAVTVILLLIFLDIKLNFLEAISILMILLGTVIASLKYGDLKKLRLRSLVAGVKLSIFSSLAFGTGVFIEIILVKDLGWFIPAFFIYLTMLLYNLVYSVLFRLKSIKVGNALVPTILAGLTAATAFLIFNYGVMLNYSIIVTPLAGAATVLTVLFGILVLKENLENSQKLGILLIVSAIIILSIV